MSSIVVFSKALSGTAASVLMLEANAGLANKLFKQKPVRGPKCCANRYDDQAWWNGGSFCNVRVLKSLR